MSSEYGTVQYSTVVSSQYEYLARPIGPSVENRHKICYIVFVRRRSGRDRYSYLFKILGLRRQSWPTDCQQELQQNLPVLQSHYIMLPTITLYLPIDIRQQGPISRAHPRFPQSRPAMLAQASLAVCWCTSRYTVNDHDVIKSGAGGTIWDSNPQAVRRS